MKRLILTLILLSSFQVHADGNYDLYERHLNQVVFENNAKSACTLAELNFTGDLGAEINLKEGVRWAEVADELGYEPPYKENCMHRVVHILEDVRVSSLGKFVKWLGDIDDLHSRAFLESDAHAMCELAKIYFGRSGHDTEDKNVVYLTRRADEMSYRSSTGSCMKDVINSFTRN